jgi:hypothetical protein
MMAPLELPEAFSVRDFCGAVERATGRPIALHPQPPGWGPVGLCGLLLATSKVDHVLYTDDDSRIGQATTIIHECGHILYEPDSADAVRSAALPPGIDLTAFGVAPGEAVSVRGRTNFSDLEERTVETFASLVLSAGLAGDLGHHADPADRLVRRFG